MRRLKLLMLLTIVVAGTLAGSALSQVPGDEAPPSGSEWAPPPLPREASPEDPPVPEPDGPLCTSVSEDSNFRNFWAGGSFDGLPMTRVTRWCTVPKVGEIYRANMVEYQYGSCIPDQGSCTVPIVVQSWPAQDRNRQMYVLAEQQFGMVAEETTVGGIPATWFEGGRRLEVWRPDTTVAIFGDDRDQILRFAHNLILGPSVLADLQTHGVLFEPDCTYSKKLCWGDRVGVWVDDIEGLCFNVATDPPTNWCGGQSHSPVNVWYDQSDGICFSSETVPVNERCTGTDSESPIGVWYTETEGLCVTLGDLGLFFWCSGQVYDPVDDPPIEVWQDPQQGICFQVSNATNTYCTGAIQT